MRSISGTPPPQPYPSQRPPHPSEKNRLASAIGDEVSSGAITATDATALTTAVEAIDASLQADGASGGSTASGTSTEARLDPSGAKDRIDGLIADQVTGGTLTSDQAATLKSLFAQGDGEGGGTRIGGYGRGGPPAAPPSDAADDASSPSGTGSTGGSTSSSDDLLASFIQQLKASQSGGGYAQGGSSSTRANPSALLFDFET
ncbi:hypothetical protein [uncultured Methylobacterium sp.]|uniref:hypothetical protein n=1 Tax=uncultured Methylobacterium sp. TaxID=157278 RepID=UPI0035CA1D03